MSPDDGLRAEFRKNLPDSHMNTIETGSVQLGVPDLEICANGVSAWVECKATSGWCIGLSPYQIGWHMRRHAVGGRSFIAVRRRTEAGPRKGVAVDDLYIFHGSLAPELKEKGLRTATPPLLHHTGGPSKWKWDSVLFVLTRDTRL